MDTTHCMASAISAGLGAMTFRNHLRSLTEISDKTKGRLKTAAKVGAGALAVGGAAKLAYDHYKGNDTGGGSGSNHGFGDNPSKIGNSTSGGVSKYATNVKSNAPDTDRHIPSNTERNLNPGKKLISGTNERGNRTGRPADTTEKTGKKLISGKNTLGNRTGRGQKELSLGSGDNKPGNRTGRGQQSDLKYSFIKGKRNTVKGLNAIYDKFKK